MSKTIGSRLIALRDRSGLTLRAIAQAAGYASASSVQSYFNSDYDRPLWPSVAARLASALENKGDPPIKSSEVLDLASIKQGGVHWEGNQLVHDFVPVAEELTPTLRGQPKDVPVYGSALAADLVFDSEGNGSKEIEITNFEMGDVITHVRRPPGLNDRRKVYAIFVSGSSMEPRYRPGDPVFVDPQRPPSIGDDVVVQLVSPDGTGDIMTGLIKTMVRRTSTGLVLEQYSPAIRFSVPIERIAHIHRVIPWREAFGM